MEEGSRYCYSCGRELSAPGLKCPGCHAFLLNKVAVPRRVAAFLLDLSLIAVVLYLLLLPLLPYSDQNGFDDIQAAFLAVLVVFYFPLLEGALGATLGKSALRLRVVRGDRCNCGYTRAWIRHFLRVVDNFFFGAVGLVTMATSKEGRRVGDMVAGTYVVNSAEAVRLPRSATSIILKSMPPLLALTLFALAVGSTYDEEIPMLQARRFGKMATQISTSLNVYIDTLARLQLKASDRLPEGLDSDKDAQEARVTFESLEEEIDAALPRIRSNVKKLRHLEISPHTAKIKKLLVASYSAEARQLLEERRAFRYLKSYVEIVAEMRSYMPELEKDPESRDAFLATLSFLSDKLRDTSNKLEALKPPRSLERMHSLERQEVGALADFVDEMLAAANSYDAGRAERSAKTADLRINDLSAQAEREWSALKSSFARRYTRDKRAWQRDEQTLAKFNARFKSNLRLPEPLVSHQQGNDAKI